nr:hypothetical protein [Tanacetum cinerariifolium]
MPNFNSNLRASLGHDLGRDCVCSKGNVEDKILVPKPPENCARCARCGHPVDCPNCQECALLRRELEENLVTHSQDFQDTFESSSDNTNVVNAPREPFNSLNDSPSTSEHSSQSPPHINHCCYECGDPLDGIFYKRCTCKSCGKDANIGYNCPPKVPVISNPKPCKNQTIDELPQTLPSFHPTFHSEDESPFTCDSTPTYVDESPNVFNPPTQPLVYSCEFCGNDAHYGHYCTPQAPFIYLEPCYNQDFNFPTLAKLTKQMTSFTSFCEMACQIFQKKQEEKQLEEEQAAKAQNWKLLVCYDDDDDEERSNSLEDYIIYGLPPCSAITPNEPFLSTEEPDNSLSMGDEHLDTIPVTESSEVIKSSAENLISILIEASPPDSELVSLEVMEIVIPEVGGIDDDILLTIKDDILREKLLNVNLLIAKIKALNDNPTPSSDCKTKSSSTFLNSLLEETNTSDNSLSEFETFCFDVKEISSGKISSDSPTTHSDFSLYVSFIFNLSINLFPPADRSDFYEFTDALIPFISPPELDVSHRCGTFPRFKILPERPMEIFSSTCTPMDK